MKKISIVPAALALLCAASTAAALTVPGADGSDGAFSPVANVEVDLGLADASAWDAPNPGGNAGQGVYDENQWAVVFRYTSVNIPAGVKVTFKNHPSGAPVVWLVSGNVTIAGELNLDGKAGVLNNPPYAEGGPGGFRGGSNPTSGGKNPGYGPGAGRDRNGNGTIEDAGNEAFNIYGLYAGWYGNSRIIPLIGGSGGSVNSDFSSPGENGGGGGGAILIASASDVTVGGIISAKGGVGNDIGYGSGGAIRIVAESLAGIGSLRATSFDAAGLGRIRLEANAVSGALSCAPATPLASPGSTAILWPDASVPTARISSVGGNAVDPDPRGENVFQVAPPDVALNSTSPVQVDVAATNVSISPGAAKVVVRVQPLIGRIKEHTASYISGTQESSLWQATIPAADLPVGGYFVQVRAVTD